MKNILSFLLAVVIVFCGFSFPVSAASVYSVTPDKTITVYNSNGDAFVLPVIADAYEFQFLTHKPDSTNYYLYFLASPGPFLVIDGLFQVPSGYYLCYPVDISNGSYNNYNLTGYTAKINPSNVVYSNFNIEDLDGNLLYAADTIEHYTISFVTGFEDEDFCIDPVTIVAGSSLTLPAVDDYNGYTFSGWFYDSAFQNAFDSANVINGDLTLYAKYEAPAVSSSEIVDAINSLTARLFPADVLSVPFAQYSVTDTLSLLCFVMLFLIMLINFIRSVF